MRTSTRNSDAVSVRQITRDFAGPFDEPAALGLLQWWPYEQGFGHGTQHEHGSALIFLTEQTNQFRAPSWKIQPAHL